MARHSLVLVLAVALGATGCLVTGNPDLSPPPIRGPYLSGFSPATYQVILVKADPGTLNRPPVTIGLTLSSDDDGQTPSMYVQLDFLGSGLEDADARFTKRIDRPKDFPPGDFDHPRTSSFPFTLGKEVSAGCHSVTAIVVYEWDNNTWLPAEGSRSASVTWWLDVDDGAGPGIAISSCPGLGAVTVDGGSDSATDGASNVAANAEGGP